MEEIETLVVGAGVIGLAIARALASAGHEVVIAEACSAIGTGISSRNSEVIHAGIYYRPSSAKAVHCVTGRRLLYEYCAERRVPCRRTGKLIVASSVGQVDRLDEIRARAHANGATDVAFVDGAAARALEPELECLGALVSPSTGIVDAHALMLALLGDAQDRGAVLALSSRIARAEVRPTGFRVHVASDAGTSSFHARHVVNAAGLFAPGLARKFDGLDARFVPCDFYAKGNYFSLRGKSPFSRLIYPVPVPGGLGVHVTVDLAGGTRFGPDVEWLDVTDPGQVRFDVDEGRADRFYAAVRSYYPALSDGALSPAYSGVRPKLAPKGAPDADFVIQGPADHGVSNLVNLFGIESPGLTAALSIAEHVSALLED